MNDIRYRIPRHPLQGITVLLLLLMAACSDSDNGLDDPTPPEPVPAEITVEADTESLRSVEPSGGSITVSLTATAQWTATVEDAGTDHWLSVSPASGRAGETTVTLTIAANESPDARSASVVFVCGDDEETLTVTQQQGDVLAVSQEVYELPATASTMEVNVQANIPYTTEISVDWINAVTTRSLTEETLTFQVAANEDTESREGTITFTSKDGSLVCTVTVKQAGEELYLEVTPQTFELPATANTMEVNVQANIPYTTEISVDWINAVTTRSLTEETLTFQVTANENTGSREGTITFTSEDGSLTRTVTVRQAGEELYLEITPTHIDVPAEGGTYTLDIRTNAGNVSIDTGDIVWISVQDYQIIVAPNTDREERIGAIVVAGEGLSQMIEVTQAGKQPSGAGGQIEDFEENEEEW